MELSVAINERIVSASLDGTAPPIFPMGVARPNAASGEGILPKIKGALVTGRIGFGFTRNLTRRRGKADGPAKPFWRATASRPVADGNWRDRDASFRFLARNPSEARDDGPF